MCRIYGVSGLFIFGSIGDIPHRAIRNCGVPVMAIPRTRKHDSKKILLAIDGGGNNHRRIGNNIDVLPLISRWHINLGNRSSDKTNTRHIGQKPV